MNGTNPAAEYLDSPWPSFLDDLARDPHAAMSGFFNFAYRMSRARPPSIFSRLSREEREDVVSQVVVRCCENDLARLRSYRAMGKPFSGWLATLMFRAAYDLLQKGKRWVVPNDDEDPVIPTDDPELDPLLVEGVARCMEQMSEKCRVYLGCFADGMNPRDIVVLLGLPKSENKKVSEAVRQCLKRLRGLMRAEGIESEGAPA